MGGGVVCWDFVGPWDALGGWVYGDGVLTETHDWVFDAFEEHKSPGLDIAGLHHGRLLVSLVGGFMVEQRIRIPGVKEIVWSRVLKSISFCEVL